MPVEIRPGYEDAQAPDAIQRDLGALARKHELVGCVLIQFAGRRSGTRSWGMAAASCWGVTEEFAAAMNTLGARIMTDIEDGRHDPHIEPEGHA
jgi:hypothetical protein